MTMRWLGCTALALAVSAGPAWAGEVPLYQPAPAWVTPAPPIDPTKLDDSAPVYLLYDHQQRIENGRVWSYLDSASRASSAEVLNKIGTVTVPWLPDKGDLIVHRAEIIRGAEHIDLLKAGTRFTVLRREQNLEQREMTGQLTATMAVQGLQIGDVLHVTLSTVQKDGALKDHGQSAMVMPAEPFRMNFARAIVSWPVKDAMHFKLMSGDAAPATRDAGGYRSLTLPLPLPKLAEIPGDAPARFRKAPLLVVGDFADWNDVSRVMAPLFATDGLIAPGSPLAGEVAKIMAADPTPIGRAERALELTQDKIRYLALGMNGGNYVPQTPAQTWELRYGDCKAKTLMLLAMLRMMGIEAEATLASARGGDALANWLPVPGAFNHVLVRATIDGKSLWLDGTGAGARLIDIHDTPPLRYVLPLRPAGAGLMPVPMVPAARPRIDVALDLDESPGVDFPRLFKVRLTFNGGIGGAINAMSAQATAKQRLQAITQMVGQSVQLGQIADSDIRYDAASGTAVVTASGLLTTGWIEDDKKLRQDLDHIVSEVQFDPDRARPAWQALPVATPDSGTLAWHTRITLPNGGTGFTIEGDKTLDGPLGGLQLARSTTVAGATVTVDERAVSQGLEIAPDAVAAERARVSNAKEHMLRLVAPKDTPRRWDLAGRGRADPRFAGIEAAYAKVIAAAEPTDTLPLRNRASFRAGIFDRRGAIDDIGRAIAIDPSEDLYLWRARLHDDLGETAPAMADIKAALALDPASLSANLMLAEQLSDGGDTKAALALVDDRIAVGGKQKPEYQERKAEVQADGGDTKAALATLDAAIADKTGDPGLLNSRCWIKGTRNTALDTALKDCTKSIELSDNANPALDSRAMVYFRMGRTDDALADLDAVLDATPDAAGSRFLRGVILKRTGKTALGENDLRIARLLSPQVDRLYKKYGVVA